MKAMTAALIVCLLVIGIRGHECRGNGGLDATIGTPVSLCRYENFEWKNMLSIEFVKHKNYIFPRRPDDATVDARVYCAHLPCVNNKRSPARPNRTLVSIRPDVFPERTHFDAEDFFLKNPIYIYLRNEHVIPQYVDILVPVIQTVNRKGADNNTTRPAIRKAGLVIINKEMMDLLYASSFPQDPMITVKLLVADSGALIGYEILSPEIDGLQSFVTQSLQSWEFLPATENGAAVTGTLVAQVDWARQLAESEYNTYSKNRTEFLMSGIVPPASHMDELLADRDRLFMPEPVELHITRSIFIPGESSSWTSTLYDRDSPYFPHTTNESMNNLRGQLERTSPREPDTRDTLVGIHSGKVVVSGTWVGGRAELSVKSSFAPIADLPALLAAQAYMKNNGRLSDEGFFEIDVFPKTQVHRENIRCILFKGSPRNSESHAELPSPANITRQIQSLELPVAPAVGARRGSATADVYIDEEGKVTWVDIIKASSPEMGFALRAAMEACRFYPFRRDGRPAPAVLRRKETFDLVPAGKRTINFTRARWADAPREIDNCPMSINLDLEAGTVVLDEGALDEAISPLVMRTPVFPLSVDTRESGVVELAFVVDENGRVRAPKIVFATGEKAFVYSAIQGLSTWGFTTPRKNGRAVCVSRNIKFIYEQGRVSIKRVGT